MSAGRGAARGHGNGARPPDVRSRGHPEENIRVLQYREHREIKDDGIPLGSRSAMSARVYERNGGTLFEMGLARFMGHECQRINRSVGKSMIVAAAKYAESNGGSCSIARAFCALKGWAGSGGGEEQAIRCLYSCAQGATKYGNGTAEFLLGDAYHYGEGVQRDYAKAAKFYGCAADKGHGGGCHMLAVMYEKGRGGLERSLRIATVLYEKAVATGHCVSRYNLANILADSCCRRAVKLYSESAAQGHIDAKYNLGLIRYGSQQDDEDDNQSGGERSNSACAKFCKPRMCFQAISGRVSTWAFGRPMDARKVLRIRHWHTERWLERL